MSTAPIHCPACNAPLHLSLEPVPVRQPVLPPLPQAPMPPPAPPVYPRPEAPPRPRHSVPQVPARARPRRRLSPQATLLSLGVLLLLAAGVTFLAVNWDTLPVQVQAGIIGTLAALAFAGAVPASRHALAGTAEALAILGCGLLTVDLFGARALELVPPTAIDGFSYSAIAFATVALINLLMTRLAPKVVTFGVTTVIAGQLPVPLLLLDRVSLHVTLAALLAQVVVTLVLSGKGTPIVRRTGSITSSVVFCGILLAGTTRILAGLVTTYSTSYDEPVVATTAVVCLAGVAGLLILRKRPFEPSLQPLTQCICASAAAFAVATCLPQLPGPGRWLTTGVATGLRGGDRRGHRPDRVGGDRHRRRPHHRRGAFGCLRHAT